MNNQGSHKNMLGHTSSQGLGAAPSSDGNTLYGTSPGTSLYDLAGQGNVTVTTTQTIEHIAEGAETPELNENRTYPIHSSEVENIDAEVDCLEFDTIMAEAQQYKSEAWQEQQQEQEIER